MRIFWIALSVVVLDQLTKYLARTQLGEGSAPVTLIPDWLKLTYTENAGIAFGIDLGGRAVVTVLSIVATLGICYYLYRTQRSNLYYRLSFGLIIGGAVGNLIDRAFYGQVVDFIHFDLYNGVLFGKYVSLWPIFNVADAAITIGVAIMFIWYQQVFEDEPKPVSNTVNATDINPSVVSASETNPNTSNEPAKPN
ncbi:MAG: signal peptidase II [Chloroherpetonaceae bacterium]|nr:signal peptidase II [Chloroherpetonaceae bacterium]